MKIKYSTKNITFNMSNKKDPVGRELNPERSPPTHFLKNWYSFSYRYEACRKLAQRLVQMIELTEFIIRMNVHMPSSKCRLCLI